MCVCSLKPDNLLLASPQDMDDDLPPGCIKVADLGCCAPLDPFTGRVGVMTKRGTVPFMASELFREQPSASTATDVFALGGVLLELSSGKQPFQEACNTLVARAHKVGLLAPVLRTPASSRCHNRSDSPSTDMHSIQPDMHGNARELPLSCRLEGLFHRSQRPWSLSAGLSSAHACSLRPVSDPQCPSCWPWWTTCSAASASPAAHTRWQQPWYSSTWAGGLPAQGHDTGRSCQATIVSLSQCDADPYHCSSVCGLEAGVLAAKLRRSVFWYPADSVQMHRQNLEADC